MRSDLDRHKKAAHRNDGKVYQCPWADCDFSGASRKDNLLRHMKKAHPSEDRVGIGQAEIDTRSMRDLLLKEPLGPDEMVRKMQRLELELFEAATQGDLPSIQSLLKDGVSINAVSKPGRSALWYAAKSGHTDTMRSLIQYGSDIRLPGVGKEAFLAALLGSHIDTIEFLLSIEAVNWEVDGPSLLYGASVTEGNVFATNWLLSHEVSLQRALRPENFCETCPLLTAAVSTGKVEIVSLLLEYGADVKVATKSNTPLSQALRAGLTAMVRLLLQHGAKVDSLCTSALVEASKNAHIDAVELLLKHGLDVNGSASRSNGTIYTPLSIAARYNHIEMAKLLLQNGAKLNLNGGFRHETALYHASAQGHIQFVQLLLEIGADINGEDSKRASWTPPLAGAARYNQSEVVKLLLAKGADPNQDEGSPLVKASLFDHVKIVELLLAKGADPNLKKGAALSYAARYGHVDIMQLLLEHGAKDNSEHVSLLSVASENGRVKAVELLLERGADSDPNKDGYRTPLYLAVNLGYFNIAQLLMKHGAKSKLAGSPNSVSTLSLLEHPERLGTLAEASKSGNINIAKVLLDSGADPNFLSYWHNRYALFEACRNGHMPMVELLLERGAEILPCRYSRGKFSTPQEIASRGGYQEIVELLDSRPLISSARKQEFLSIMQKVAKYDYN